MTCLNARVFVPGCLDKRLTKWIQFSFSSSHVLWPFQREDVTSAPRRSCLLGSPHLNLKLSSVVFDRRKKQLTSNWVQRQKQKSQVITVDGKWYFFCTLKKITRDHLKKFDQLCEYQTIIFEANSASHWSGKPDLSPKLHGAGPAK